MIYSLLLAEMNLHMQHIICVHRWTWVQRAETDSQHQASHWPLFLVKGMVICGIAGTLSLLF